MPCGRPKLDLVQRSSPKISHHLQRQLGLGVEGGKFKSLTLLLTPLSHFETGQILLFFFLFNVLFLQGSLYKWLYCISPPSLSPSTVFSLLDGSSTSQSLTLPLYNAEAENSKERAVGFIEADISNYHYKFTGNLRDLGSKLPPKVDDHPSPIDFFNIVINMVVL
ncbi:hypothetical protein CFP56_009066 [Quercus suber]|uniref:Uncharacterized protein n=1 Tax=Quercus suber TaxID=58331 RepID=A0AAW0L2Y1_QUESU